MCLFSHLIVQCTRWAHLCLVVPAIVRLQCICVSVNEPKWLTDWWCCAVVVRRLLRQSCSRRSGLRRLLVSAARVPRPAGGLCRLSGPFSGYEEPHRRAHVAGVRGLGPLPSSRRLLSAADRPHRGTTATAVFRRPAAGTAVLSRRACAWSRSFRSQRTQSVFTKSRGTLSVNSEFHYFVDRMKMMVITTTTTT